MKKGRTAGRPKPCIENGMVRRAGCGRTCVGVHAAHALVCGGCGTGQRGVRCQRGIAQTRRGWVHGVFRLCCACCKGLWKGLAI